jgi:hypothetical protein
MALYKRLKLENPKMTTIDFRVLMNNTGYYPLQQHHSNET